MPRISHFDIPVDNPERAQKFYSDVFDWKFEKWNGPMDYWITKTGNEEPGIDGGMSKRIPGQMGISTTINVPSLDEFAKKVTDNGGHLIIPKMPIPKTGWFAQCTDTEGNMFGIFEDDDKAE